MIRVHVVHRVGLFRSALVALLRCEGTLDVTASPWRPNRQGTQAPSPHVWVTDVDCLDDPASTGRAGRAGSAGGRGDRGALLVLTPEKKPGALLRAFEAGALGYVSRDGDPSRLIDGIHQVANGERFVDDSLACDFLQATKLPMTPRELSVLALAAQGSPISDIATSLHLSSGTIRNYLASAIRKVGGRNRMDAIRISQDAGWL
ncbi:helix-turn-helix transcriptional regulator [Streptomyces sp. NBC_01498]|uniref:helix-turn-helix transcriptional regulator n=1 Tax=Streptomyces sp. NBC_01498 TaxID=2975870 RepID=UPI002E7AD82E|nr:DNA-binding response regulator [Streptomyces sp. NBC_01498]